MSLGVPRHGQLRAPRWSAWCNPALKHSDTKQRVWVDSQGLLAVVLHNLVTPGAVEDPQAARRRAESRAEALRPQAASHRSEKRVQADLGTILSTVPHDLVGPGAVEDLRAAEQKAMRGPRGPDDRDAFGATKNAKLGEGAKAKDPW